MLGLAYLEADTCRGCGKPLSVTTAPDVDERSWQVTRHTCTACEALAIHQKHLDSKEYPYPGAYLWTAEKQT